MRPSLAKLVIVFGFIISASIIFSFWPSTVYASSVDLTVNGNTLTAKLVDKPDALSVQGAIFDKVNSASGSITYLIVDGEFGSDNAAGMAKQLYQTSIEHFKVKNSNYIPAQFFLGGPNGTLKSYEDDGSVSLMNIDSLSNRSNYKLLNNMTSFLSPGLKTVYSGVFDNYHGTELILPQVTSDIDNGESSYNNFFNMPNVTKIDLSGLTSLKGSRLFSKMPSLTTLNLSKIASLSGKYMLDAGNKSPLYVDLSSLTTLSSNSVGSTTSSYPIYAKLGSQHPENLFNDKTNLFGYTEVNPLTSYSVNKGDTVTISCFGEDDYYSFNSNDFKIEWYMDGNKTNYEGAKINVDSNSLSDGNHIFQPVVTYKGIEETSFFKDTKINVQVNEDKSSIEVNDSTIHVGDQWNPESNFESATNKAGNQIGFSTDNIQVTGEVNTSKAGTYPVTYSVKDGKASKEIKVTVVGILSLSVPKTIDFGSVTLGPTSSALNLTYPGGDIKVEDSVENSKGWTLTAKVSDSTSDFNQYLMNGDKTLAQNSQLGSATSGGRTTVSEGWQGNKTGLWVDYSTAQKVRTDDVTIEYTLTPSDSEVAE